MIRLAYALTLAVALGLGPAGAFAQGVLKAPDETNADIMDEALSGLLYGLTSLIGCDPDASLSYEARVTDSGARLTDVSGSWRGFTVVAGDVVEVFDPVAQQGGFSGFLTLLAPAGPAVAISTFGLVETSGLGGTVHLETNTFYPSIGGDPPLGVQSKLNDIVLSRRPTAVTPTGTQYTTSSTGVETYRLGGELGDLGGGSTETKTCVHTCSDVACFSWTPGCTKVKAPGAEGSNACRVRSVYSGTHLAVDPSILVTGEIEVVAPSPTP